MKDQQTTRPKARRVIMGTLLLLPVIALAENWTEFRGPGGQGHVADTGLPLTWSETENITWKTPIPGLGWSSPVIQGRQIWLTTAAEDGKSLRAVCVDRDSGKIAQDVEVFRKDGDFGTISTPRTVMPRRRRCWKGTASTSHFGRTVRPASTVTARSVGRTQQLKYDHRHGPGGSPVVYRRPADR